MNHMRITMILLTLLLTLLSGCAMYTVDYVMETLDVDGNVITRSTAHGRAFVANTSDEVSFQLKFEGDDKEIHFGKVNTGGAAQVEALGIVADRLACVANPATCALIQ